MTRNLLHFLGSKSRQTKKRCQYCDGCIKDCHCEVFKGINDGLVMFDGDIDELIPGDNRKGSGQSHGEVGWRRLFRRKTLCNSRNDPVCETELTSTQVTLPTRRSRAPQPSAGILLDRGQTGEYFCIGNSFKYHTFKGYLIVKLLRERFISDRNRKVHSILGDYCPVRFRNEKYVDYEGEQYKVTQECLAQDKLLEQEGREKPKYVHNPSNGHVFWLIRPFNFDKDYRYSMFCEKALQRRDPWTCYHQGIQSAPRKHLLRKWLNRKWEWETIIDYIFKELGPESELLVQNPPGEGVIEQLTSAPEHDTSGSVGSRVARICDGTNSEHRSLTLKLHAFEKLVSICDFKYLVNDLENFDMYSVLTI